MICFNNKKLIKDYSLLNSEKKNNNYIRNKSKDNYIKICRPKSFHFSKAISNRNVNISNFNHQNIITNNLNTAKNNNIKIKNINTIYSKIKIYNLNEDKNNDISFNDLKTENNSNEKKNNEDTLDNLINNQNKSNKTRNNKNELKYQSSDELLQIALNKEKKLNRKMKEKYYSNDNFKSEIPKFASHLPKSIYHVYQFNNKNIDQNCSICLEDFIIGQEILTLPCFHFFHCNCISKWLMKKKLCPICHLKI